MYLKIIISALILIYVLIFFYLCIKAKMGIKLILLNSALGIFVLTVVKLTSFLTGIAININVISVSLSTAFGISGVAGYILMQFLFL